MNKRFRHKKITTLLNDLNIQNQDQLQSWLLKNGINATQTSISRDLKELGAVKVHGYYRLPDITPGQSHIFNSVRTERAGDNLIVFKTDPSHAPVLAALIDRSKIPGVVGTIAGDNTVFTAISSAKLHKKVLKNILALVKGKA